MHLVSVGIQVDVRSVAAFGFIAYVLNPIGERFSHRIDPNPDDLMATLCRECLNDVAVLAWEVLVYKEETHHSNSLKSNCF